MNIRLLSVLFLASGLRALALADPETRTITIQGSFTSSTPDVLQFNFHGESYDSWATNNTTSGSASHSMEIKVGKQYALALIGLDLADTYSLTISAPQGFDVLLSNPNGSDLIKQSQLTGQHMNQGASFVVAIKKRDGPQVEGMPFGESTSWDDSRPIWSVGMGTLTNGEPAGVIEIRANDISSVLGNPSDLIYTTVSDSVAVVKSWGNLRQINAPNGLADIITISSTEFRIDFYDWTQVTGQLGGLWTTTGAATVKYTVKKSGSTVELTKTVGGTYWNARLSKSGSTVTMHDWSKNAAASDSTSIRRATTTVSVAGLFETRVTTEAGKIGGTWVDASKTLREYQLFPWGTVLIRELKGVGDPNPAQRTTTYTYYTSPSDGAGSYRRLKRVTRPDGGYAQHAYYNDFAKQGLTYTISEPFQNAADGKVTTFTYTTVGTDDEQLPSLVETKIAALTYGKTAYLYERLTRNGQPVQKTTITQYADPNNALQTVTLDYAKEATDPSLRGQPHSVERPDGSMTSWSHMTTSLGGFKRVRRAFEGFKSSPSGYSSSLMSTVMLDLSSSSIEPLYVVPNQSTFSKSIYNAAGHLTSEGIGICSSGTSYSEITSRVYSRDSQSRIEEIEDGAGNVLYEATYADGLLSTEKDETGAEKEYVYDTMMRVSVVEEIGKTYGAGTADDIAGRETRIGYDGSSRVVSQDVSLLGDPTGESIQSDFVYDKAGRLISKTMDCCDTVLYAYPAANQVQTTHPDGGATVETYYLDGSLASRTGSAAAPLYVQRAVMTAANQMATFSASEPIGSIGQPLDGWLLQWSDWLGRTNATTTLNDAGTGTIDERQYDPATGRLAARHARQNYGADNYAAPYRYVYDGVGHVKYEGLDVDADGALSEVSANDRPVKRLVAYWKDTSNRWWATTKTYGYPTSAGTPVLIEERRARLTPVSGELSRSVSIDQHDNATTAWTVVDRAAATVVEKSQFDPGGAGTAFSVAERESRLGLLVRETSASGSSVDYEYDSLRRLKAENGRDEVRVRYGYVAGSRKVRYVWQENLAAGASNLVVENVYASGRLSQVKRKNNASGTDIDEIANYAYDAKGNVTRVWGNGADPVLSHYDAYGRLSKQYQFRDPIASSSDFPTLDSVGDVVGAYAKKYTKVAWIYGAHTGVLKEKRHYDGATARTVAFAYNELGQLKKRTWARGVYTDYGYSIGTATSTGELLTENHSDATPDVAYTYDRMGRVATVSDATGARTFNYASQSGLAMSSENLPDAFYGAGKDFVYAYETAGAGKVPGRFASHAYGAATWSQAYQPASGRVASIAASAASPNPAFTETFAYAYDADSDHVDHVAGSSYKHARVWESWREVLRHSESHWGAATRSWYQILAGNGVPGMTTQCQIRSQYLTRTDADSLAAKLGSAVDIQYVAGYDARGQVSSWDTSRAAGVESSYAWDSAGNPASYDSAAFETDSLNQIDPAAAGAQWTYDHDGDLAHDQTWTYAYDANNRLESMHKTGQRLAFAYDYMGRRVEKKVWNNTAGTGTPATHLKYAYQGMELSAELTSAGALRKTFHWGLDKSDARGGLGGAMGLLMWRDHASGQSYYPSYDLNGNLAGLLNASGTYVAWYEYDAFGKVETEGGAMKDANPIRYSTQYTDDETGLVYYGFRYYDPSKGRFLTRDPIGEQGGLNLYRFVGNNPVSNIDVWGLSEQFYICDKYYEFEINDLGQVRNLRVTYRNCTPESTPPSSYTIPGPNAETPATGGTSSTEEPKEEEEEDKRPPCSQVRKELLGDLLPNTNSVDGVVDGARSYTPGLVRGFEGGALGYTPFGLLFFGERSAAIRQADQTLRDFAVAYATDEEVQRQTNAIGEVFVQNNIGRFAGRAGAAVTVGQVIQRGMGGSGWYGPLLSSLAIRGDVNYMIRNNVDPGLAVAAGIMGATSAEAMGEFAHAMSDKELAKIIPCEEGK